MSLPTLVTDNDATNVAFENKDANEGANKDTQSTTRPDFSNDVFWVHEQTRYEFKIIDSPEHAHDALRTFTIKNLRQLPHRVIHFHSMFDSLCQATCSTVRKC